MQLLQNFIFLPIFKKTSLNVKEMSFNFWKNFTQLKKKE